MCVNLPQCQTDCLNSFSVSAQQTILTPQEIKGVTLRLTVSQSVCLGVEPRDQILVDCLTLTVLSMGGPPL
jgi:hypothetical protein